jgi:tetratricopeptide (TPR) repeat protein
MFRTVTCVVVLAMMQTMVEAQRLTSVIGDGAQLVADRLPAPDAAVGSHRPAAMEPARRDVDTLGNRKTRLAELERVQQEPRHLLAPGLPHGGQTKLGQLHDAEAVAPTDAGAAPTAPATMGESGDADGPRDPALASEKGGSVLVRQGSLPTALDKYLDALAIAERLAQSDPANADWQRDLAVSHEKIGDALLAQGNFLAALANFRAALAIVDRLAKADPESADRQAELAMSHEKIGNVLAERGHLLTALDNFRVAHAIADRLAKTDPKNASWQLDLAMSHDKIGDVLAQQNKLPVALKSYRAALEIFNRLAKADPENAGGQLLLALSHEKIGGVLVQQGNLSSGLESYRFAFAITEHLAQADPGNAGLQSDVSTSHLRIAEVLLAQGKLSAALESYRASLAVAEPLARADPGNGRWQKNLSLVYARMGRCLSVSGQSRRGTGKLPHCAGARRATGQRRPGEFCLAARACIEPWPYRYGARAPGLAARRRSGPKAGTRHSLASAPAGSRRRGVADRPGLVRGAHGGVEKVSSAAMRCVRCREPIRLGPARIAAQPTKGRRRGALAVNQGARAAQLAAPKPTVGPLGEGLAVPLVDAFARIAWTSVVMACRQSEAGPT